MQIFFGSLPDGVMIFLMNSLIGLNIKCPITVWRNMFKCLICFNGQDFSALSHRWIPYRMHNPNFVRYYGPDQLFRIVFTFTNANNHFVYHWQNRSNGLHHGIIILNCIFDDGESTDLHNLCKRNCFFDSLQLIHTPRMMSTPFSIVIVAKDEEKKIGKLLGSIEGLTDDVILLDTGSADATPAMAEKAGAKVHHSTWKGYGKSKNEAIGFAKYDWILSLDSDEKIDPELYQQLKQWQPLNDTTVHQVLWKNFF